MRTERASVSTTWAKPQAAEFGRQALGESGGESHVRKVARKPPLRAGPQHFDRDGPHAFVSLHLSPMHLGDRSRRHGLAETLEHRFDLRRRRRPR